MVKIKSWLVKPKSLLPLSEENLPSTTLLIAAYNEEDFIREKIQNSLALAYPKAKLEIIFVTDGSSDSTPNIVAETEGVTLLHEDARSGKINAIKRAMKVITSEIIVFTDANTLLNKEAIINLVKHYQNERVGAVAGEKRIKVGDRADASSAGESFYWRYESFLKRLDYQLYSNVGAAGELFSIRTKLYQPIESDTIIDDHMIAMRVVEKGYIIAYEPDAYAVESGSENSAEELKRKIRIAAGGIQSIFRLGKLANPFFNPILTFQYIGHRVLRWLFTPTLLIVALVLNILIWLNALAPIYTFLLVLQALFYLAAAIGYMLEVRKIKVKAFFIPYYFTLMNYAALLGTLRYLRGNQSAAWEKSRRKAG